MPQTYTAISALLKTKLEGLQDGDGNPIFYAVYDYKENEFQGYPVATIAEKAGEGEVIDNHRNERDFIFEIRLWQEIGTRTKAQAATLMRSCVDAVMASFDQDINLNGSVARVRVVPVEFDFNASEAPHDFAVFLVRVVDLVYNYPV